MILFAAIAFAQSGEMLAACLDAQDIACAKGVVEEYDMTHGDPVSRALAARVPFYDGDYPAAYDLLKSAVDDGYEDPWDQLALYERAMFATAGWRQVDYGDFRVRYQPGVDAILLDGAVGAARKSRDHIAPFLGGPPPGSTILEIYPEGADFVAASSLTKDDVAATGVVALSKWTRLLVTSPRALARGYDWQDTIAHEYIHLVVAHHSLDRAPVWLQEGIAKFLDGRWKTGKEPFRLDQRQRGLLSAALKADAFVPFDEMHPSLAKIKVYSASGEVDRAASAERAGLAYAQLATMIAFAFEKGGDDVLTRVLPRVAEGIDPRVALAEGSGFASFAEFEKNWVGYLKTLNLDGSSVASMPMVLDGTGDEADADPALAGRRDLAQFVRLGEMLADRGHFRAALMEYDRAAEDPEAKPSPLITTRRAQALVGLERLDDARAELEAVLDLYPTSAPAWATLGAVAQRQGRTSEAIEHLMASTELNPFDIDTQRALSVLAVEAGDREVAARQDAILEVIRTGGLLAPGGVIHTREGEYELPRSPEAMANTERRFALEGQPAPDLAVELLEGGTIAWDELQGSVVLLDFWATWCGPCIAIMPELSAMAESIDGLRVIGITDEPPSTVNPFLKKMAARKQPITYDIAIDRGGTKRSYGVSSLPTLFVVDTEGIVREVHIGSGGMAEIRELVLELLED